MTTNELLQEIAKPGYFFDENVSRKEGKDMFEAFSGYAPNSESVYRYMNRSDSNGAYFKVAITRIATDRNCSLNFSSTIAWQIVHAACLYVKYREGRAYSESINSINNSQPLHKDVEAVEEGYSCIAEKLKEQEEFLAVEEESNFFKSYQLQWFVVCHSIRAMWDDLSIQCLDIDYDLGHRYNLHWVRGRNEMLLSKLHSAIHLQSFCVYIRGYIYELFTPGFSALHDFMGEFVVDAIDRLYYEELGIQRECENFEFVGETVFNCVEPSNAPASAKVGQLHNYNDVEYFLYQAKSHFTFNDGRIAFIREWKKGEYQIGVLIVSNNECVFCRYSNDYSYATNEFIEMIKRHS